MLEQTQTQKITCSCPHGHRLRGSLALVGETVACPRCKTEFLFGKGDADVTDSAVMQILGDPSTSDSPTSGSSAPTSRPTTRPCQRCGVGVSETMSVCQHCQSYVGILPSFMQQLQAGRVANT